MGQDGGAEGSGPSRHVNIPWSYWFSKYEIRNDQYAEFLNTALVAGEVWREGTTSVKAFAGKYEGVPADEVLIKLGDQQDVIWNVNNFEVSEDRTNFPVRVKWYGAIAFAQHYGYDLPTEAEWEKAARGPDHDDEDEHRVYPWGDSIGNGNANYYNSGDPWDDGSSGDNSPYSYRQVTPVGFYDGNQTPFGPDMANGYGLYDLIGNVCEWTRTVWADSIESYQQQESLAAPNNSLTGTSDYRVARGGSWISGFPYGSGSASRHLKIYERLQTGRSRDYGSSSHQPDMGFRVIRRDVP
jgi:formylglycine-generating enzyme required for sulfatase activity